MEVIAEKSWSWMLFADGDHLFLSVVCGGVGIYEIDFELTGDEAAEYRRTEDAYLDQLASAVRSNPAAFEIRRLTALIFGTTRQAAVTAWRQKQQVI